MSLENQSYHNNRHRYFVKLSFGSRIEESSPFSLNMSVSCPHLCALLCKSLEKLWWPEIVTFCFWWKLSVIILLYFGSLLKDKVEKPVDKKKTVWFLLKLFRFSKSWGHFQQIHQMFHVNTNWNICFTEKLKSTVCSVCSTATPVILVTLLSVQADSKNRTLCGSRQFRLQENTKKNKDPGFKEICCCSCPAEEVKYRWKTKSNSEPWQLLFL